MIERQDPHRTAEMNLSDDFDNLLTRQLRNTQEYLPDDGFTAGVMAQIDARPPISPRTQHMIIGIPLVLISGLVFSQLPVQDIALLVGGSLTSIAPATMIKMGALLSGGIIITSIGWLARQARLI